MDADDSCRAAERDRCDAAAAFCAHAAALRANAAALGAANYAARAQSLAVATRGEATREALAAELEAATATLTVPRTWPADAARAGAAISTFLAAAASTSRGGGGIIQHPPGQRPTLFVIASGVPAFIATASGDSGLTNVVVCPDACSSM